MKSYRTDEGDGIAFKTVSSDNRDDPEYHLNIDHAAVGVGKETLTINAGDDSDKITDAFLQDRQLRVRIDPQGGDPVAYQGLLTDETTLRVSSRWSPES